MAFKRKYPIRKTSPFQTRASRLSGLSPLKEDELKNIAGYLDVDADTDTKSEQGLLASATEGIRKNLAENLNPYSYEDPLGRIYKASRGEKSSSREFTDEEAKSNFGLDKERVDLLQIVMGQPQKHNAVTKSKYKPTESKDPDAEYYSSKFTEKEIKSDLSKALRVAQAKAGKEGTVNIKQVISSIVTPTESEKKLYGTETNVSGTLGQFKIDKGVDEKGHYISYYDIWDLNPIPETGVNTIDVGVGKVASYLTKKAGLKSPEIYGRIYYDPKTGKIIE